ncbi:PASTA domain-containing protein [Halomonas alimentaria]|uniref:PASTA domain-containing protein n=1 Tax=Halomonas alimentaria TaxID=147248 RepID=A0A7X4W9Z0_9GAMM|nr:PASTA domain-containing protein [Halomonas alimentaria]NAW35741.1 PASTA domain-containing protein [Halomonas alimentaria]
MTIKLRVTATLLTGARQPAANQVVELQVLQLKRGWTGLARTTSNAQGKVAIGTSLQGEGQLAPALRLVRSGDEPVEVLAQQGTYHMARTNLNVAFGEVVVLPGSGVSAPTLHRLKAERLAGMNANLADLLEKRGRPGAVVDSPDTPGEEMPSEALLEGRKAVVFQEMLATEVARREQLQMQLDLRQARVSELDVALKESVAAREDLSRQLEQLRKSVSTSPAVEQLTSTVSGALELARGEHGMQLATAELRIRGLVVEGGKRFHPLDVSEAREILPDNVSELVLRLDPPRSRGATEAAQAPDLIGQTLESARRQALAQGLRLDVIESVSPDHPEGAIFDQRPSPGAALEGAGGRLVVVVATGSSQREIGDE